MSAKVTVDDRKIDHTMGELLGLVASEVGALLVDIADDAEHHAEAEWYTRVRKRTGRTGTALRTDLRVRAGTKLEAVVSSDDKRSYVVHSPGPLSTVSRKVTADEYAHLMSEFRRTGKLPSNVKASRYVDGQPINLVYVMRNPLASDGKTLWSQLVLRDGKKMIASRSNELDSALQRAADKLRQR